jgi:glucose/mannose-6-phosphate isomerase
LLDFKKLISKYDKSGMNEAISGFSNQINTSLKYMEKWVPKHEYNEIQNILIIGMGGSAIGGDFVASLVDKYCSIPIIINRSYNIPGWVNENTIVISSSYSGNTEETLSALEFVRKKNARVIAVTTGGKLKKIAKENNFDIVEVTSGLQPRAAIGYSISLNLLLLEKIGIVKKGVFTRLLKNSVPKINILTKELSDFSNNNCSIKNALLTHDKFAVIYASEGWQANCALRLRGQLAENSKILSSHLNFPEQNHNEIEGWTLNPEILKKTVIIWITDVSDHPQVQKRMSITKELLSEFSSTQYELKVDGDSDVEKALSLIHLIDWISYYSALMNNIDPTPVERITILKNKLSEE